jgi:hypothetical protein
MKKKTARALGFDKPRNLPSPANLASRVRRVRNELALMLAAVDDGLQRIEASDDGAETFDDA